MSKKITIYTIAEKANVSISTVSRILNDTFRGKKEIKQKVQKVINSLDYKPSKDARRVAGKKIGSKMIGVMAPFFTHPFFVEVLKGVYKVIHNNEYSIVLYDVDSRERKKNVIKRIQEEDYVDGVLMINMHLNEYEYQGITEKMPLVLVASNQDNVDSVSVDNYKGIVMGMRYLHSLNHRNVAFINDKKKIYETRIREKAFRDEAVRFGIRFKISYCDVDRRSGYIAAKTLIENNPELTCLYYYSDLMAYGGLDYIKEKNIVDRISIIGFDGFAITLYMKLTTIIQPMEQIGERGAEILISKIANNDQERIVEVINPKLNKGNTCRKVNHEQ